MSADESKYDSDESPRRELDRSDSQDRHRTSAQLISFEPGDPENPRNWPRWRKWSIIGTVLFIDLSVSWGASGYSPASKKFEEDMHVSSVVATLGLSMYTWGLALGPMTLAPLSEYFGRSPIYIVSYGIYLCFLLGTALSPDLGGFLALRFISGCCSSVTIANFGGTIADMYHTHDTGPPMSLFLWAATCGSPSGYFLLSFVAQTRPWRDVFWALLGISGGLWLIMTVALLLVGETRHTVLLLRRLKKERRRRRGDDGSGGGDKLDVPDELKHRGPKELFRVALTRPFRYLFTEAIVAFCALYNGYLYGLSFLFNTAFSLVFGEKGHGFNEIGVGLAFLGIVVGISLGPVTNLWQERYYQGQLRKLGGQGGNLPEARVQVAKVAGIVLPLSLFLFAWTTYPTVHWLAPVVASACWGWAFYTLILMTYAYAEDAYQVFAASALAGIGLVRNLAGGGFPLFGAAMFDTLGDQWAASLLGFLALLMAPIPFVLERWGRRLRLRSPWARQHMDIEEGDM